MEKEQELHADIAIIGAGGAGLPAAVTAADGDADVKRWRWSAVQPIWLKDKTFQRL